MRLDHATGRFQVKAAADDGTFEGYASTFGNEDLGGDIVMPGAFEASLDEHKRNGTMPAMLWQHRPDEPIGPWLEMVEDERGLKAKGRLLIDGDPLARRAHSHLKAKSISGLSIGFVPKRWEWDEDEEVRRLTEIDLWEASIVTFPMNVEARVDAVKTRDCINTLRDFETFLRDACGFSRGEAKALAHGGWSALRRDDVCDAITRLDSLSGGLSNGRTQRTQASP